MIKSTAHKKTVADPSFEYETNKALWQKCRAICNGQKHVKQLDRLIDVTSFSNLLIPFSPMMSQEQYTFYLAEAELPSIVAQFSRMLLGSLLRKQPILELPNEFEEAKDWILNAFAQDESPLIAFLDGILLDEIQTSRAWIYVDYPAIENAEQYTREELSGFKPFPVVWKPEDVINWRVTQDATGKTMLNRVIVKGSIEIDGENEFHPDIQHVIWVHELNESGIYNIRTFRAAQDTHDYKEDEKPVTVVYNGEPLKMIPAWPLNGSIDVTEPVLMPLIDKEIGLYNKVSRRNHLLYGAATYTPVVYTDMEDEEFGKIVGKGLGTWLKLGREDKADILKTPTEVLADMDRAIAAAIEEMAKIGIRMMAPEVSQSGVALDIRNAAQIAQLGSLNSKVSNIMRQVIIFMINWRYDTELTEADVVFKLSTDFNPTPLGADWLRLATEWYESGLIPRSAWLSLLKHNDMMQADYDDEAGQIEITKDELVNKEPELDYAKQVMPE
jgi:hypothetical protein